MNALARSLALLAVAGHISLTTLDAFARSGGPGADLPAAMAALVALVALVAPAVLAVLAAMAVKAVKAVKAAMAPSA